MSAGNTSDDGRLLFHYTNDKGYKAIGSQRRRFQSIEACPCYHPKGAYFTTFLRNQKPEQAALRSWRSRIRRSFVFCFSGGEDLVLSKVEEESMSFTAGKITPSWKRGKVPAARRQMEKGTPMIGGNDIVIPAVGDPLAL